MKKKEKRNEEEEGTGDSENLTNYNELGASFIKGKSVLISSVDVFSIFEFKIVKIPWPSPKPGISERASHVSI